jgi:ATP-dependent exoDNAse (exonuclease V) beta subunit
MTDEALDRDRAARRFAQLELERPVVLEAGAGTGKTTALVARLIAWTVGRGWEESAAERADADDEQVAGAALDRVVAITFTEAAAAEMAKRYQSQLAELADGREPPAWVVAEALPADAAERARRGRALLAAIDRLRVQTIHSFAFALLRAHALEGGLHPALAVDADESGLEAAIYETLAELLPPLYRAGDPALHRLARAGVGPEELRHALHRLAGLGVGAAAFATDPWRASALEAAIGAAQEAAQQLERMVAPARGALVRAGKNTAAVVEALPALRAALVAAARSRAGLVALREELARLWTEDARTKVRQWAKGEVGVRETAALAGAAAELSPFARRLRRALEHIESIDPQRLDDALAALAPLAAEVERRMRARGLATYADLLRLAVDLLQRPAVAAAVRRGIRQLLVDEFQDTDELQCELVARIALEGPPAERPGLFLVGDPKQSIYGWRRARLSTYRAFVAAAIGERRAEALVANFRSAAGVLEEVARIVSPVMGEESDVAAAFVPLAAAGPAAGERASIEFWAARPGPGERLTAAEATRREAAAIAAELAKRIRDEALAPRDVAILLRATTHLDLFLDALRERGVPFAVEKDRSYYRRRETLDAAALVRAALDPSDLLALVAVLRAPFVGVPDAALLPLWVEGLPGLFGQLTAPSGEALAAIDALVARAAARAPRDVPGLERLAAWPAAAAAAVGALIERRAAFAAESADIWVDRLRRAFLPDLTAAARWQARYRLANLDRFFRELIERLDQGEPPHRLLADLRAAARERPDEPESRPLEGAGDAVRVMTLHSAKGLEFPEVFLAGLHHEPGTRGGRPTIAAERLGGAWELRLFGVPTPGLASAADLEERIRAAEQVRLLYVGTTRAVRRLTLSGALPLVRSRPDLLRARSLAALLGARIPEGLDLSAEGASWRDEHGAVWRALPPATEVEAPRVARRGAPALPDLDAALAASADARAAAAARQAVPRIARVTELATLELEPATRDEEVDVAAPPAAPAAQEVDRARAFALARGSALHRALELAPLAASDPGRWRAAALATLELELGGAGEEERLRIDRDLDTLRGSQLFARLVELETRILARELPLVASAAAVEGALEGLTGAADLLYRDARGEPVLADFKSDTVTEAEAGVLAARYAPQLALYARAIADALGLPAPPRRELWLLALDRIVPLDEPGAASPV